MDAAGAADSLPQEVEEGNVEYKLKLVDVSPERREHLITQMNWRLNEGCKLSDGHGEAVYQLGFEDSGHPLGLSDQELRASLQTLRGMAEAINAYSTVTHIKRGECGKVAQVVVKRRLHEALAPVEQLSLATVGDAGVGKSTLAAVLATGELDNGRGLARMQVLRHNHELEEGHTSSPSHVLLGFSAAGDTVNYDSSMAGCGQRKGQSTAAELISRSAKLVSLLDLAGHPKYLKTTVGGLVGHAPDYVVLTLDSTAVCLAGGGLSGPPALGPMSGEHLRIALALGLDLVVVATKLDHFARPDEKLAALSAVQALVQTRLPGGLTRAMALLETMPDVVHVCQQLAAGQGTDGTEAPPVPIVGVSSVTGEGIDLLRALLFRLPSRRGRRLPREDAAGAGETLARVTDSFYVEDVGLVLAGTVRSGAVAAGAALQLGPDRQGEFHQVQVTSIHVNRVAVQSVSAGRTATFAVRPLPDARGAMRGDASPLSFTTSGSEEEADEAPHAAGASAGEEAGEEEAVGHWLDSTVKLRGMVLVGSSSTPRATTEFDADILLLEHTGRVTVDYEPIVHIHTVAQSARITAIHSADPLPLAGDGGGGHNRASPGPARDPSNVAPNPEDLHDPRQAEVRSVPSLLETDRIRPPPEASEAAATLIPEEQQASAAAPEAGRLLLHGQRASVRFRFVYKPEYISPGDTFVFREGCMRGVGTVSRCFVAGNEPGHQPSPVHDER